MYKNYITYKLYPWNRPNLANIKQNVKNRVRTKDYALNLIFLRRKFRK